MLDSAVSRAEIADVSKYFMEFDETCVFCEFPRNVSLDLLREVGMKLYRRILNNKEIFRGGAEILDYGCIYDPDILAYLNKVAEGSKINKPPKIDFVDYVDGNCVYRAKKNAALEGSITRESVEQSIDRIVAVDKKYDVIVMNMALQEVAKKMDCVEKLFARLKKVKGSKLEILLTVGEVGMIRNVTAFASMIRSLLNCDIVVDENFLEFSTEFGEPQRVVRFTIRSEFPFSAGDIEAPL